MAVLYIDTLVKNNQAQLLKKYNVSGFSQSSDYIGDFNGDGFDDFVLSAPFENSDISKSSVSYVIYGNNNNFIDLNNFASSDGLKIVSDSYEFIFGEDDQGYYYGQGSTFKSGHVCSEAGDFNGDGYKDIVVSVPYYNNNNGIVYLIYGGKFNSSSLNLNNITSEDGVIIYGSKRMDSGTISQKIGDLNNDGFADIAIREKNPSTITVIYGNQNYNASINLNSTSEIHGFSIHTTNSETTDFGYFRTVDNIRDINGDGFPEIAIAESNYDSNTATVFIIYGGNIDNNIELSKFNSSLGFNITGVDTEAMVRGTGDINGDGFEDIIIGSHNSKPSAGRDYAGKIYVILSNNTYFEGFDIKDISGKGFTIFGKDSFDQIGETICSGVNANNDEYDDILFGSSNDQDGAYIVFGSNNTSDIDLTENSDRFISIGKNAGAEVRSVNSAGDLNNDGYDDFVLSFLSEVNNRITLEHYLVFNLNNLNQLTELPSISPTAAPLSNDLTTGEIAGIVLGGVACLGSAAYSLYAYNYDMWPFAGEIAKVSVDAVQNV